MIFTWGDKKKTHQHSRVGGGGDLSFCGELSFTLSLLFLSASITAPTCKATIISLEPCALNADFQRFIPESNKFPYFMDTPEGRVWGERRPKERVTLQIILVFTLALCECKKKYIYIHCNRISVSVKNLTCKCKWCTTLVCWRCLPRQGYCV